MRSPSRAMHTVAADACRIDSLHTSDARRRFSICLDTRDVLHYYRTMQQAFGVTIARTLEDVCNPRDMALIVYDMQVGIVRQLAKGPEVVARVSEMLELARSWGMRIFFIRYVSLPRELMGAFQYRMAMSWQRVDRPDEVQPWFLRDSPSFQIVPELVPRSSEAIFDRITMSAFEGTPLSIALRDC